MTTNEFLPVAIGGTPNVQAQVDYATSPPQVQGWADGAIPPAKAWNKMLRQASCIAALVAQAICNLGGIDMLDNGDQATKLVAFQAMFGRKILTGNTVFYISNAGSNVTGDGTSGNPWQTPQFAIAFVQQHYDLRGYQITFQLADYASSYGDVTISGGFVGLTDYSNLRIQGNTATPANTKIGNILFQQGGARGQAQYLTFVGSYGLSASSLGFAAVGNGCVFTNMGGYHIDSRQNGIIYVVGNYTISGGAAAHFSVQTGGTIIMANSLTITCTGTPNFGTFALFTSASKIFCAQPSPFTGAATGTTYTGSELSLCENTGGGGYFPGNSGGVLATGALYL